MAQPSSASTALQTFLSGEGDVLLDYEDDALYAQSRVRPISIITPPQTILIQNPIAVTKAANPSAAKAFVAYLLSPAGQKVWGKQGYRPVLPAVAAQFKFPKPKTLFTIDSLGGWTTVNTEFFDPEHRASWRRSSRGSVSPPPVAERRATRPSSLRPPWPGPGRRPTVGGRRSVGRVVGPALAVTYLSACWSCCPWPPWSANAFSGGWGAFWGAVSQPEAVAALKLTLVSSLAVAAFNSVAGLVIAWVLVRDDFRGKAHRQRRDRPALRPAHHRGRPHAAHPLRARTAPSTSTWPAPRAASSLALAFVTLPFCVRRPTGPGRARRARPRRPRPRSAPPRRQVLCRVILPERLAPAMLAGAGLAFARAVGEFGSVVLISGNLPFKTEVASSWIFSLSQSDDLRAAAAVSVVLVLIALLVLLGIGWLRRRFDISESV